MILQQNTNRAAEADSKVKRKNHEKLLYKRFLILFIFKLHILVKKRIHVKIKYLNEKFIDNLTF